MPISIRRCSVSDIEFAPNLSELLAEYSVESAILGLPAPSAQWETYRKMEAIGAIHVIGAFDGDAVVGLASLVVSAIPHYGAIIGTTESLFVLSAYRKGGIGLKIIREAERCAKMLGAVGLFISAPTGGRLEQVLPRVGFRATNSVFFRELK